MKKMWNTTLDLNIWLRTGRSSALKCTLTPCLPFHSLYLSIIFIIYYKMFWLTIIQR
ncbi:uncharacterized protein isoform X2 [Bombus fervidus]|uniref:uncharacterized protein isoform X2 n=1 Tax=Bombus fervidus TaxID=203811 RepID=UPI003D1878B0